MNVLKCLTLELARTFALVDTFKAIFISLHNDATSFLMKSFIECRQSDNLPCNRRSKRESSLDVQHRSSMIRVPFYTVQFVWVKGI